MPTPFITYLNQREVSARIQTNCANFFTDDKIDLASVSRIFNDLPLDYNPYDCLLKKLPDAIKHHELSLWFDFATYIGMVDLFDTYGDLRPEIHAALNPTMDKLFTHLEAEKIHGDLLSAYLIRFMGEKALALLNNKYFSQVYKIDHPSMQFAQTINQRCWDMNKVNRTVINTLRNSILKALDNPKIKSKELLRSIDHYFYEHPEIIPGDFTLTGWTSIYSKKPSFFEKVVKSFSDPSFDRYLKHK